MRENHGESGFCHNNGGGTLQREKVDRKGENLGISMQERLIERAPSNAGRKNQMEVLLRQKSDGVSSPIITEKDTAKGRKISLSRKENQNWQDRPR